MEASAIDYSCLRGDGCRIPAVELRGISRCQLHALLAFLRKHKLADGTIDGWWDTSENSATFKQAICYATINLYQACNWVILPATREDQVSYVEWISSDPDAQRPLWFVSHAWAEPIVDFVTCIDEHCEARGLLPTSPYWVCAYCNNQHRLDEALAADPRETSFFKAMGICVGVLLLLDEAGPATPFRRVWCCFEEAVIFDPAFELHLLLDIATVACGETFLLCDGLTTAEWEQQQKHKAKPYREKSGWTWKCKREERFPIKMLKAGLEVHIESASATRDSDRRHILNSLAGLPSEHLDEEPLPGHPAYSSTDRCLASLFALAGWRKAVKKRLDISDGGELPLARALRQDEHCQDAHFTLAECKGINDDDIATLAGALPYQLKVLSLDLTSYHESGEITTMAALGARLTQLTRLEVLRLALVGCAQLRDVDGLAIGIGKLTMLSEFRLELIACGPLSFEELERCIGRLVGLKRMALNFAGCDNESGWDELLQGLGQLRLLTSLELNFDLCSSLVSTAALGSSLSRLENLEKLQLDLSNMELESVDELGRGIGHLSALTSCELRLVNEEQLTDIAELGNGLGKLSELRSLILVLTSCEKLCDCSALGRGLGRLAKLRALQLGLSGCRNISQLEVLGEGLGCLKELVDLQLDLENCRPGSTHALTQGIGQCSSLQSVKMLLGCAALFDSARLGEGLEGLSSLVSLHCKLQDCHWLSKITMLSKAVGSCAALRKLHLTFDEPHALASISDLGGGLGQLLALESLTLDFLDCPKLTSITGLTRGISCLPILINLDLTLYKCEALEDIGGLGSCLAGKTSLRTFRLRVQGCLRLTEVDELCFGRELAGLSSLTLLLVENPGLQQVNELCRSIRHLVGLTCLSVDVSSCKKLASLDDLGRSISFLRALSKFKLECTDNPRLSSVSKLARGLMGFGRKLTCFEVNLTGCKNLPPELRGEFCAASAFLEKMDLKLLGREQHILDIFREHDDDGTGNISRTLLQKLFSKLGFEDADTLAVIDSVSIDGDGRVRYAELLDYLLPGPDLQNLMSP